MQSARACAIVACWLVAAAVSAPAQARKPGLWTITTIMTRAGHQTTSTTTVCLTPALIDKFGAPIPNMGAGCRLTKLQKTSTSMSGTLVCSGTLSGQATLQSTWNGDHATGGMQFTGSGPTPMTFSTSSTAVFKGADCGSVPPYPMPQQ